MLKMTNDMKLSKYFRLAEFTNLTKYPTNYPFLGHVVNMAHGCRNVLDPARELVGPIIVTSGYRCVEVNKMVGGVHNSQHLTGNAADIKPANPANFELLVQTLRQNPYVDQLLTGRGWLHVSWVRHPEKARRMYRKDYYKY